MADETMIVEVHELERYMNASFDSAASFEAKEQLDAAQSELEGFLNRPIVVRQFTDKAIEVPPEPYESAWRRGNVYFPDTPVVELQSLSADGTAVDVTGMDLRAWGIKNYPGNVGTNGFLVATYRAGLDGKNDPALAQLRTLVKRRAAREMIPRGDGSQGTTRLSDEGYSQDAVAPEGGYTEAEKLSVRRHKRRRLGR